MTNSPVSRGALCNAIVNSDIDRVRKLLDEGADPNAKDTYGNVPLLYAASRSLEIVELLVDKGADPDIKSFAGGTPIKSCILAGASVIHRKMHADILRFLIGKGANINKIDADGKTALAWANAVGNTEAIKIIKQTLGDRRVLKSGRTRAEEEFHNTASKRQAALNSLRSTVIIRKNIP